MFDVPGVLLLLATGLLLAWLARRAWRAQRSATKWLGTALAGLAALVVVALFAAALVGYWKLNRTRDNPVAELTVAASPELVARGQRFGPMCGGCHSPDTTRAMVGRDFLEDGAPPIGDFRAPGLTPAQLAEWTDGEIVRAIREGVHRSGRSLLIMPSSAWRNLSDGDVQSIVAYLRSLPAEGSATPPNRLNVLGAILAVQAPIFSAQPPITGPVPGVEPGPTASYGTYLSSFTCATCHGPDLEGDAAAAAPPLAGLALAWTETQFIQFMRTGSRPDGSSVDGQAMPWRDLSRLLREDSELRALYAYLQQKAAENAR